MSEVILESQPKPRTKSTTTSSTKTVVPGSSNGSLDFSKLVADHRAYFLSGVTRSAEWRESQLIALRSMMKDHAEDFYAALWSDLRRNRIEADLVDVKCTTSEIDHVLAHFRRWMKPVPISTPYQLAPSHARSAIRSSRCRVDYRDMELSRDADVAAVSGSDFRG